MPAVDAWPSAVGMPNSGQMSGVAFHYLSRGASSRGSRAPSEVSAAGASPTRCGTGIEEEMLRLESVSQISGRSRDSRRSREEPPTWLATTPAEPSPEDEPAPSNRLADGSAASLSAAALIPRPKCPPPERQAPTVDQLDRQQTVLQLSSLLHAWWEGENNPSDTPSATGVYHERTRPAGNRVGLLVDPGAHDNLVGGLTATRMEAQVGIPNKQLRMTKSLQVEGVGQNAQSAEHASRIALKLKDTEGKGVFGSFTAPVIQGSALPPLLGLRSLKRMSAVLDTKGQKLYLPGAGGLSISRSPATRIFDLELSPSGHLILPVHHPLDNAGSSGSQDVQRLDFPMTVREREQSREQ